MKPSTFLTNVARFWGNVDRTGECWVWLGEKNNMGYGRFEFWHGATRTRVMAHRLSLMLLGVELGASEVVMHSCDNPPCVNPAHLSIGTQRDNIRDALAKGRMDLSGLELGRGKRERRALKKAAS